MYQKDSLLCESVHMMHYSTDPCEGGLYSLNTLYYASSIVIIIIFKYNNNKILLCE